MVYKILLIVACVLLVVGLIVLGFYLLRKNKSNKKTEIKEYPLILEAIGGKDNVNSISLKGTRISIELKDKNKLNKDQLKENGITTIVVSNLKLTMALNSDLCESVYAYLDKVINNK